MLIFNNVEDALKICKITNGLRYDICKVKAGTGEVDLSNIGVDHGEYHKTESLCYYITSSKSESIINVIKGILDSGRAVSLLVGALRYNVTDGKESSYLSAGGIEKAINFGVTDKCWESKLMALYTRNDDGTVKVETAIMDSNTMCVTGGSKRVNEITTKVEEELIEVANKLGVEFKRVQRFE